MLDSEVFSHYRILKVEGTSGLVLPGADPPGLGGAPSSSGPIPNVFARSAFVVGLMVLPLSRLDGASIEEITAGLAITVADENQEALLSDGRGSQFTTNAAALASVGADCLSLVGRAFRPFPLQRAVRNLYRWVFTVQNKFASDVTLGGIYLYVEDHDS